MAPVDIKNKDTKRKCAATALVKAANMKRVHRHPEVDKALFRLDAKAQKNKRMAKKKVKEEDFGQPMDFVHRVVGSNGSEHLNEVMDHFKGLGENEFATFYAACLTQQLDVLYASEYCMHTMQHMLLDARYEGTIEERCLLAVGIMQSIAEKDRNYFRYDSSLETSSEEEAEDEEDEEDGADEDKEDGADEDKEDGADEDKEDGADEDAEPGTAPDCAGKGKSDPAAEGEGDKQAEDGKEEPTKKGHGRKGKRKAGADDDEAGDDAGEGVPTPDTKEKERPSKKGGAADTAAINKKAGAEGQAKKKKE